MQCLAQEGSRSSAALVQALCCLRDSRMAVFCLHDLLLPPDWILGSRCISKAGDMRNDLVKPTLTSLPHASPLPCAEGRRDEAQWGRDSPVIQASQPRCLRERVGDSCSSCPPPRKSLSLAPPPHSPDVNYEELARCTDDFNGAQCKAVCVEAVSVGRGGWALHTTSLLRLVEAAEGGAEKVEASGSWAGAWGGAQSLSVCLGAGAWGRTQEPVCLSAGLGRGEGPESLCVCPGGWGMGRDPEPVRLSGRRA